MCEALLAGWANTWRVALRIRARRSAVFGGLRRARLWRFGGGWCATDWLLAVR